MSHASTINIARAYCHSKLMQSKQGRQTNHITKNIHSTNLIFLTSMDLQSHVPFDSG